MKSILSKTLAVALCAIMVMTLSGWSDVAAVETRNAAEQAASAETPATLAPSSDTEASSPIASAPVAAEAPAATEALTPASDKGLTVTVDGVDISTCQLPDLLVGYTDPHRAYVSIRNNDPWYDSGTLDCYFTSDDSKAFIPQQIDIQDIAPLTSEGFYVSIKTGLARGSYSGWLILWPGVLHDIEFRVNVWDILPTPSNLSWEASYPTHAQWSVAEGGSGTTLQLFKDGTADANKVGDPVTVGTGVQSYDFSALMSQYGPGTYYFKAQGLGSEENLYEDSVWSQASAGTSYLTNLRTANSAYTVSGDHTGWIPTDMSVVNSGNAASGQVNLTISGTDASVFTLDATPLGTIAAGSSGGFSVTPAAGLSVGTQTATLTIYENGTKLKEVPLSATIGDYLQPGTPENLTWSTTSPGLLS